MRLLLAILLLLVALPVQAQQSQGMSQAVVVSSCGGGALPSGALNQLTMDPQGRLCQSGIGSNVCSQATAYLARTTGGNEGGNAANITTLICGLVADGVITGNLSGATGCGAFLDTLYVFAQQNTADAQLNICGTSYSVTLSGNTFTSYKGYSGFTNAISTNFNAATAPSPHFVQNSGNFGVWPYGIVSENEFQMGTSALGSGGESNIATAYQSGGFFYGHINTAAGADGSTIATGALGLYVAERTGAATNNLYLQGVSVFADVDPSAPTENTTFKIGNVVGPSAQIICEAHIGASMGATLNLALYTRLRTYMTAVGVP